MPPELIVSVAGQEPRTYSLIKEHLTIGRSAENDIVITSTIISSYHASLDRGNLGYTLKLNPSATNPFYYQGKSLSDDLILKDGDVLRVG
jgi:pSer/pThr/pTyr-binding forkhead associated (FHA) protein